MRYFCLPRSTSCAGCRFRDERLQPDRTTYRTVTDSSGSVVPAAKVVATNIETGVARNSMTNEAGNYPDHGLCFRAGTDNREAAGFKQTQREPVVLADRSGRKNRLHDASWRGQRDGYSEASAVLLVRPPAPSAMSVENLQVTETPLNGRDPIDMVGLATGVRVQAVSEQDPVPGETSPRTAAWQMPMP